MRSEFSTSTSEPTRNPTDINIDTQIPLSQSPNSTFATNRRFHDPVTHLPNRELFLRRLEITIQRQKVDNQATFAVLCLNIQRFKYIHDSFGVGKSDEALQMAAQLLVESTGAQSLVARFSGDTFMILLEGMSSKSLVMRKARHIQAILSTPFSIDGVELSLHCSIGIYFEKSQRPPSADSVVRNANIAMEHAKKLNRDGCVFFEEGMHIDAVSNLELDSKIRKAIRNNEFELHYQPIIDLHTGKVASCEALIRWNDPEKNEMVEPGAFIPHAEKTGIIEDIDDIVLLQACRQLYHWQKIGLGHIKLGINISGMNISSPVLAEKFEHAVENSCITADSLEIEVTETAAMNPDANVNHLFKILRNAGVEIAIDDFGIGYSSLSYLHKLKVQKIKIDQSFVRTVHERPESKSIIKTIVMLAHELGAKVVAEGIETKKQLQTLIEMGCDYGQGFFFSEPLSITSITEYLQTESYTFQK